MPELMIGFIFLFFFKESDNYAGTIGTTAGSAVFNSLIIPGIVLMFVTIMRLAKSVKISTRVVLRDGLFLIAAELLLIFTISGNNIGWAEGLGLIIFYVIYIVYLFTTMPKQDLQVQQEIKEKEYDVKGKKAWAYLILSVLGMSITCYGLTLAVEQIGILMDIPLIFTAIVLAAAASSVPDTVISLKDARRGNYDDSVSNALGSNIFDIAIAHGLPLFLYTMIFGNVIMTAETTAQSIELRVGLLILTAISLPLYIFNKKLGFKGGLYLIGLYAIFILYIVGQVTGHPIAIEIGLYFRNSVDFLMFWN